MKRYMLLVCFGCTLVAMEPSEDNIDAATGLNIDACAAFCTAYRSASFRLKNGNIYWGKSSTSTQYIYCDSCKDSYAYLNNIIQLVSGPDIDNDHSVNGTELRKFRDFINNNHIPTFDSLLKETSHYAAQASNENVTFPLMKKHYKKNMQIMHNILLCAFHRRQAPQEYLTTVTKKVVANKTQLLEAFEKLATDSSNLQALIAAKPIMTWRKIITNDTNALPKEVITFFTPLQKQSSCGCCTLV